MKKTISGMLITGTLALGLAGCGGVQQEAKVATAVQTMMVLAIEAAIRYNTDDALADGDEIPCSESGTYKPNLSIQSIIDFITGGAAATTPTGTFTFSQCKMKICGDEITIDGDATFVLEGALSGTQREINLTFNSSGATTIDTQGIIEGAPEFEYLMNVEVTDKSLGNISIEEAATPAPLEYKGKIYRASKIKTLAQGC